MSRKGAFMNSPVLYRKRLIPAECVLLDKDKVIRCTDDYLITTWDTIRPKKDLSHGISAFFWKQGVKVSKFYDHQDRLICWYCDIITHEYQPETNTYITIDLLADVLVYPDGQVKVVDLDELADAVEQHLISQKMLLTALRQLNTLLDHIYSGKFAEYQSYIEEIEKAAKNEL